MPSKRIYTILSLLTILMLAITWRIFYLQIITGPQLASRASSQRAFDVELDNVRGQIYDRNLIPLLGRSEAVKAVILPLLIKDDGQAVREIARILRLDYGKFLSDIGHSSVPLVFDIDERQKAILEKEKPKGVSLIRMLKRYNDRILARHVIGYVNNSDKKGQMGIEKAYDQVLQRNAKNSVAILADATHKPIDGLGYRVINRLKHDEGQHVKLTLDYQIQKQAERILKEKNIQGGIVVEEVDTGDILAMASMPDYDQNAVEKYLGSSKNELFNRSVAGYDLGSVFKIVVAAAALEGGHVSKFDRFYCGGSINVDGMLFGCTTGGAGGHGMLDMRKAFAVSCNTTFIQIGLKTGPQAIFSMAKRLGFGTKTGIESQGIEESSGNVPEKKYYSRRETANISIGQGEILATPLQVVDMISTVANGGIKNKVNIVDALVNSEGKVVQQIKQKESTRVLSRRVADEIKTMMEEVTLSGTGKKAVLPAEYGGSAGKTGSAETGIYKGGEKVVHAWFGGYFPARQPRYAVTVFVENGKYGGEIAAPVFRELALAMIELGY